MHKLHLLSCLKITFLLFHLFVVDVGDVVAATLVGATALLAGVAAHVVGVEAGTGVSSTGLLLGIVHVLAGSLPCLVHLLHSGVNLGDVAGAVGGLQFGEGGLDGALLLGGNLVAIFLQVLLALEDHAVGGVNLLNLLLGLLVGVGIGFCLGLHALDFVFAQTAGGLDADVLALAGGLVEGADIQVTSI